MILVLLFLSLSKNSSFVPPPLSLFLSPQHKRCLSHYLLSSVKLSVAFCACGVPFQSIWLCVFVCHCIWIYVSLIYKSDSACFSLYSSRNCCIVNCVLWLLHLCLNCTVLKGKSIVLDKKGFTFTKKLCLLRINIIVI